MTIVIASTIQQSPASTENVPPGGIILLPGFVHEAEEGIDSSPGKMYRKAGLSISYDIGLGAGNSAAARHKENPTDYYQVQRFGGHHVEVTMRKDGRTIVTIDYWANFFADVSNSSELTDFLLTVLTYPLPRDAKAK
jgi:hypothetical protein